MAISLFFGLTIGFGTGFVGIGGGKKSWEGTAAMFLVSLICGLAAALLYNQSLFSTAFLPIAAGAAVTELFSPSEYDTVTVPSVILAVLLLFLYERLLKLGFIALVHK